MSEKENIVVKYAKIYELKLKSENYSDKEIDIKLNEWIKDVLKYIKNNPELTEIELEQNLSQDNIISK